jgi:hypothetical protein
MILPIVLALGCHHRAPVEYAHTGPNCMSLDPRYYESLSDEDLAVCAHRPVPQYAAPVRPQSSDMGCFSMGNNLYSCTNGQTIFMVPPVR